MSTAQGANLNGFRPFTSSNLWNTDISSAPAISNSSAIINFIGANVGIHPDFVSGLYNGSSMGIDYVIVNSAQGLVNVNFTAYGDESDPRRPPRVGARPQQPLSVRDV